MTVLLCVCGERLEGSDDELFGILRTHSDAKHPEFEVTDDDLRTTLEAWSPGERWDGELSEVTGTVEVKPLGLDTLDDFLRFFDRRAFMDNPFWFGCYCIEPHHGEPKESTPAENREEKIGLIRGGTAKGYLAYADGDPVGWCNAAPRGTLDFVMRRMFETEPDPDEPVGSIACFTIAAPWRGSGVATTLLEAACDGFREQGLRVAEAYPPKESDSQARSYRGPLDMYLSAGFERYGETERNLVVRKQL